METRGAQLETMKTMETFVIDNYETFCTVQQYRDEVARLRGMFGDTKKVICGLDDLKTVETVDFCARSAYARLALACSLAAWQHDAKHELELIGIYDRSFFH